MGWFSRCCSSCDGSMLLIQRIALILLLAIPAFTPNTAFADYPSTVIWKTDTGTVFYGDTAAEALDKYVAHFSTCTTNTQYINTVIEKLATTYRVNWLLCSNNSQLSTGYIDASKMDNCNGVYESPYNGICTGTPPTPTCTAPLVLDPATNTCKDPCIPKTNQYVAYSSSTAGGGDSCINGCAAAMIDGDCGSNTAGVQMCFYNGQYTGSSCDGSESGQGSTSDPAANTPEYDCIKSGKSYGTAYGVVICVAAGTTGSAPTTSYEPASSTNTSTSTTDSSGVTTTTESTQTGVKIINYNPDGTVTTETTNSTTNADGTTTQTQQQETQAKEDFCAANPASTNCKQQTQCEENPTGPTCKHFCERYPDSLACYDSKSLKDEINAYSTEGIFQTKNITTNFIKETIPEAQGCPPPINISLGFTSVSIPYDWICDYASYFRNVIVAFAYLAAITIVFGAFKKE